ncbi:hypothetical protein [Nocardioides fonticola]|uniref:hypothetical protein n=1 Tax=Nocardioides fonticola TaxID=450363 RepID=UPI0031DA684C
MTTVPVTGVECTGEEDFGVAQVLVQSVIWLRQACSAGTRLYRVMADGTAAEVGMAQTEEPGYVDFSDALFDWVPVPDHEGTFAFVDTRRYRFVIGQVRNTSSVPTLVELTSTDVGASDGQRSWALVATPDGDQAISAGGYRYDLTSGSLIGSVDARHDGGVVAIAPSGGRAFLGYGALRLYRPAGTKPWLTIRHRPFTVADLAISDDRIFQILKAGDDPVTYRLRVIEPKLATDLTAKVGPKRVGYRSPITVSVDLGGVGAGAPVRIFAMMDGRQVQVGGATTDDDGHAVVDVRLTRSTELTASYAGDATHDAAVTKPVEVMVGAKLTARYRGARSTDGAYAVYRSTDDYHLVVRATPDHTGDCLTLVTEIFASGRWTGTQYSRCIRLGRGSAIDLVGRGEPSLAGERFRQKVILKRDADNDTTPSEWNYLRFIG